VFPEDIEAELGKMKSCFEICKKIYRHDKAKSNEIFKTCLGLHNLHKFPSSEENISVANHPIFAHEDVDPIEIARVEEDFNLVDLDILIEEQKRRIEFLNKQKENMTNPTNVQINNNNNNNNSIQLSKIPRELTTNQKRSHQTEEDVSEIQESSQQSTQVKNAKRRRPY
jgi:hypothetical protein